MSLRAALLALVVAACAPQAGLAEGPVWQENATRLLRDYDKNLPWANTMGDWVDTAGKPLGAAAFARSELITGKGEQRFKVDVTDIVRRHGADFRLNSVTGIFVLHSREADTGVPELRVTRAGTTRTLNAVADTELNVSTVKPLGDRKILNTRFGVLMRFDQGADPGITRAELVLTSPKRYGREGAQLLVFRPVVLDKPTTVTPGATFAGRRPETLRTFKNVAAILTPGKPESAHGGRPARTIIQVRGSELQPRPNSRIDGDIFTGWFEGDKKTALSDVIMVPGAPAEAYLTVVIKLHDDWKATGGKLPGLSNTGLGAPSAERCQVGDKEVGRGGWGGRPANGCRWSARTHFRLTASGATGGGTYFYALRPGDINGVVDFWSKPLPQGRWFAYVQYVRLNDPDKENGEMAYWLVDRQTAPGGARVQSAGGITYRSIGTPQSAINELWANVYCGGHNCGPIPWPRYTMSVKRLTVTDALPDLAAIQAEVDRLNAAER